MKINLKPGNGANSKPWIAHITGPDPKYGLKREFLKATWENGEAVYELVDGYFEINDPSEENRKYVHVQNGSTEAVSKDDVVAAVAGKSGAKKSAGQPAGNATKESGYKSTWNDIKNRF